MIRLFIIAVLALLLVQFISPVSAGVCISDPAGPICRPTLIPDSPISPMQQVEIIYLPLIVK